MKSKLIYAGLIVVLFANDGVAQAPFFSCNISADSKWITITANNPSAQGFVCTAVCDWFRNNGSEGKTTCANRKVPGNAMGYVVCSVPNTAGAASIHFATGDCSAAARHRR
jgi:hypothetical protein